MRTLTLPTAALLTIFVALLSIATVVPLHGRPRSVDAGLVIGLSREHTIWIAMQGDSVTIRRGAGLYVPRRSGWWRVGYQWGRANRRGRRCSVTLLGATPDSAAQSSGTFGIVGVWAAPLGRTPVRAKADHAALCARNQTDTISIDFVGTDHIALVNTRQYWGDTNAERGFANSSWLGSLDSLARYGYVADESEEIVAGPIAHDTVEAIFRQCTDSLTILAALPKANDADREAVEWSQGFWRQLSLTRDRGRWGYEAIHRSACNACGNEAYLCPARARPPSSIVGADAPPVAWTEIRRRVPDAIDAFASPNGGMVVVRDSTSLRVFAASAATLGAERRRIPLSAEERIAVLQWAVGSPIGRWSAVMQRALTPTS
jgi:hypothetical protein